MTRCNWPRWKLRGTIKAPDRRLDPDERDADLQCVGTRRFMPASATIREPAIRVVIPIVVVHDRFPGR